MSGEIEGIPRIDGKMKGVLLENPILEKRESKKTGNTFDYGEICAKLLFQLDGQSIVLTRRIKNLNSFGVQGALKRMKKGDRCEITIGPQIRNSDITYDLNNKGMVRFRGFFEVKRIEPFIEHEDSWGALEDSK